MLLSVAFSRSLPPELRLSAAGMFFPAGWPVLWDEKLGELCRHPLQSNPPACAVLATDKAARFPAYFDEGARSEKHHLRHESLRLASPAGLLASAEAEACCRDASNSSWSPCVTAHMEVRFSDVFTIPNQALF